MKKRLLLFFLIAALSVILAALSAAEELPQSYFRVDEDRTNGWKMPLANARFLTAGEWRLTPFSQADCEKYGVSPGTLPDTAGLDTLNISGSAAFSESQFRQLATDLRRLAGSRQIWIVDCRLESHALVNGISVSWYGDHNWANKGLTLAEAEADEASRFGSLAGSVITVYRMEDNLPVDPFEITVERCMSERELVESEGFHYLRLAGNDHCWPEPEAIVDFLSLVAELKSTVGLENVWMHFHCCAGKSRTGIFMAIYDMIKNPGISFDDIMLRQAMTGSSYLPYANRTSDLAEEYIVRAQRIRQIYDFLHGEPCPGLCLPAELTEINPE